jgi:hypothetical protein
MASSNTMAIKEVANIRVENFSSSGHGTLLFRADYATETTISTTGTRLDVRGGQGHYKLVSMDYQKDCTFKSTLSLVDINVIALKTGLAVSTGATTSFKTEFLSADSSNTITIAQTPLTGTLHVYLKAYDRDIGVEQTVGTPATTVGTYSIASKIITLNATTAPVGTEMIVTYDYTTGSAANNIKLSANHFPAFIRILGEGFGYDDQTGQIVPITFDIKKAKVTQAFDLTMKSDTATTIAFECDCYTILDSVGDRTFCNIVKLNDEAHN